MHTLLYISASQYSGSTLASFLLNTHPSIVSVGHMTGWQYGEDEKFFCSCGEQLEQCRFFYEIATALKKAGLPFEFRNFGTEYRLAKNESLNHLLTTHIPRFGTERLEVIRDWVVEHISIFAKKLEGQDLANYIFIQTALDYMKASVFVDNSHDPYRFRHLSRIKKFNLKNIYLVRDPRGVAYSHKKHKSWDVALSTKLWLRRQEDILRITKDISENKNIYYEDLCRETNKTLALVHQFVGLPPAPFEGDFKMGEHHILGNVMRLKEGKVKLDTQWKEALTKDEISKTEHIMINFINHNKTHPLTNILRHYLDEE